MIPIEVAVPVAVPVAVVPETVRGIDAWGTPLVVATPGVGITPIPVPVEPVSVGFGRSEAIPVEPVSVALGRSEATPLVSPLTIEPRRSPLVLVAVGLAVGDTAGTLTAMVEDPVGVVVVSAAGMEMPRLSRRLPWEEVVAAVVDCWELVAVAVAVVLEFVPVAPSRLETSEPTALRRESLVEVAALEVAVVETALEPVAEEEAAEEEAALELPRPSRLDTSPRRESLVVAAAEVADVVVEAELSALVAAVLVVAVA